MRYDTEQKQLTHDRIVREAAEAIRLDGPDKVGVAALMAKVGLTHGGFYAHFKSKDALVAEAVTYMFDELYEKFQERLRGAPPAEAISAYIDWYLSTRHRDRRDRGCPVVALSGDVVRLPATVRKRFDAGVQRMIDSLARALDTLGVDDPRSVASIVMTEMLANARVSIKTRLGLMSGQSAAARGMQGTP
jgi:TetR/AcrR family transcriptional repressor of nem operon